MKGRNRTLGKKGEDIAVRFLTRKGYKIIGRNVRTYVGEIDIVARKEPSIVFVEVKTRKSRTFGPPYTAITIKKTRKLIQCAQCYLNMKQIVDSPWQIDVVSVQIDDIFGFIKRIEIEHFKDAIEE
ncbi:MAG: YraN family protein [Candidatus Omnitrophota bacterium]